MNDYTRKLFDKAIDTIEGFDTRQVSDYHVDTKIEMEVAADMINKARDFLEVAQKFLDEE